ncbi:cytochrome aa3 quinol oxidase subunit II [Brevibacillus formosus]|uniref:cytochrome aa3 quinol oxidase subunit II n=1 Tax=Brevibacillus formosus TaxID=54913 RepID=UPI003F19E0F5
MSGGKMLRHIQFWILAVLGTVLLTGCGSEYLVLNPKGPVAETQYNLIIISTILVAVIIVPVIALTAFIVYRYRDTPGNKASYKPEWAHSTTLEVIWWIIPIVIVALLGYFTVRDVYVLKENPNKEVAPMTIQVTALDWKWMFTYPEQNIATVNHLEIPAGVPIRFQVSADAPMNSFWVPELGGQIYAMAGMATELYLQADEPGTFAGFSSNFSGEGFAKMQFDVVAKPKEEFDNWVKEVKGTTPAMTKADYEELRKPGVTDKFTYSAFPEGMFEEIVAKYGHGHDMDYVMEKNPAPAGDKSSNETSINTQQKTESHNMPGMNHSSMNH